MNIEEFEALPLGERLNLKSDHADYLDFSYFDFKEMKANNGKCSKITDFDTWLQSVDNSEQP